MTYLIYDTALNGDYTRIILHQEYPNAVSLFEGTKDEALSDIAPYIFEIDNQFVQKVTTRPLIELEGAIVIETGEKLPDLAEHLRTFIYQTIKGRECYFRFWDGRILRKFLPTCSKEQITAFFGPMEVLTMRDTNPAMAVQYRQERGKLLTLNMPAANYFGGIEQQMDKPSDTVQSSPPDQASQRKLRKFL